MALFSSEKVSNSLPVLESCLIVPNLYFIKMMTHCTQSPLLTLVLLITDSFGLVENNKWSLYLWNYFFSSPSITREMKYRNLTLERKAVAWYRACLQDRKKVGEFSSAAKMVTINSVFFTFYWLTHAVLMKNPQVIVISLNVYISN